ncbi:glycosyltransferase involved in cell wall biosynthesis [Isoptericola jiangsuensis]|uniref:Glycosyltransferase involved in cell wall biosynthesis n=1 Tax=Isoptericola jiangsuensis TaxID=548579 RepID=A0A2A9EZC9_9MICO|nr:glycosyltransferase family 4 protein [Isoptericola jiangsuensis]PFG44228.1 glycosyltransferase involved in cell wall biosynthesis [Isoptericola jiangsuensis]
MRVVHAVRSDGFAGVERHVSRLAYGQARAGHDVVVIGGDPAAMHRELAGTPVVAVPARTVVQVARALRRTGAGAHVVHVHMTAAELGAALAGLTRELPPVVSTRHFAAPRGGGRLGPVVAAVARRAVDAQIAISRYTAERVDGPSTVVHAGVDDRPDARPARDRDAVVLMAQRLQPEKRPDLGLEAFAASGLAARGWRLRVLGDGPLDEVLRRRADVLGLGDAVELLGRRPDVAAQMADAALFLAPSPGEHYGLSVLEAMASGIPTVADGSAGHLETLGLVDGAGLYASQDVAAGGALLAALADDATRRDELAARQQKTQRERFTLAEQVRRTDAVYAEVLR